MPWYEEAWNTLAGKIALATAGTTAVIGVLANLRTVIGFFRSVLGFFVSIYRSFVFLSNAQEESQASEMRIMQRLDRIDETQEEDRQIRWGVMHTDKTRAWFTCDKGGRFVRVNRMWSEWTGLEGHELSGYGWENAIAEENRNEVIREWRYAIDHQRAFDATVVLAHRDGEKHIKVRLSADPVRSKSHDGEILSYLGNAVFISHDRVRLPQ